MKRKLYIALQTALVLCFAATMGMGQDSVLTASGRLDYSVEDPNMMLPQCGNCNFTYDVPKQDVLNTVACGYPCDNQFLDWKCKRYECGSVPYIWYRVEVDGWGECTDLAEGTSSCPPDQCSGGPQS